jgi:hypothetical protein
MSEDDGERALWVVSGQCVCVAAQDQRLFNALQLVRPGRVMTSCLRVTDTSAARLSTTEFFIPTTPSTHWRTLIRTSPSLGGATSTSSIESGLPIHTLISDVHTSKQLEVVDVALTGLPSDSGFASNSLKVMVVS